MRRGTPAGPKRTGTLWKLTDVVVGDVKVALQASETTGDATGTVAPTVARRGTADVRGVAYTLLLLDGDFDGKITSEDDLWWFGPTTAARNRNYASMFEATEAGWSTGRTWRLASVGVDGAARLAPVVEIDVEAYLHRRGDRVNAKRWFPLFDLEAPIFGEKNKLDPKRPKSPTPPAWRHLLDLDAAVALAAKEGKPLLVDFEADWCVWCKRVDYYTYGDAEVGSWLSKLTLVKINTEFDEKRSFDGLKWGGLPSIGVFDAAGHPVSFESVFRDEQTGEERPQTKDHIPGWSAPERFALHLKNAHAAWEKAPKGAAAPGTGGN